MINKLFAYLKTLFGAKPDEQKVEVMTKVVAPVEPVEQPAPAKKAKKPRAKKSKN